MKAIPDGLTGPPVCVCVFVFWGMLRLSSVAACYLPFIETGWHIIFLSLSFSAYVCMFLPDCNLLRWVFWLLLALDINPPKIQLKVPSSSLQKLEKINKQRASWCCCHTQESLSFCNLAQSIVFIRVFTIQHVSAIEHSTATVRHSV